MKITTIRKDKKSKLHVKLTSTGVLMNSMLQDNRYNDIERLRSFVKRAESYEWFRTWFLGMVAQWLGKNYRYGNAIVPLLISKQGYNKSTFCKSLIPKDLQWGYNDSLVLSERKSVLQAMSHKAKTHPFWLRISRIFKEIALKMAPKKAIFQCLMSQCHANATRNPLIISECCNVALNALKIKNTCSKREEKNNTQNSLYLQIIFVLLQQISNNKLI